MLETFHILPQHVESNQCYSVEENIAIHVINKIFN